MVRTDLSLQTVLAERLRRQRLIDPLTSPDSYMDLFKLLQPVSPIASSRPGDPPRLVHRTVFDDGLLVDKLRAQRILVKGRFLGGSIGYVLARDLALYARAFRRPLSGLNEIQRTVLQVVQHMGPVTPQQIKEETRLLNKQIMPALHRLQEAFLVYEDQKDSDWERGWYDFATEWPEIDEEATPWEPAAGQVVLRFLRGHVFATFEQLRDWSQWPAPRLKSLVAYLEQRQALLPLTVEGLGEGWIAADDRLPQPAGAPPCVFMLHQADVLVRSHRSELKRRFGNHEVLQYLLIDGVFRGAVLGHWRIGPHDVEDIVVHLLPGEQANRREEILAAVARVYQPPYSHILRYAGNEVSSAGR